MYVLESRLVFFSVSFFRAVLYFTLHAHLKGRRPNTIHYQLGERTSLFDYCATCLKKVCFTKTRVKFRPFNAKTFVMMSLRYTRLRKYLDWSAAEYN